MPDIVLDPLIIWLSMIYTPGMLTRSTLDQLQIKQKNYCTPKWPKSVSFESNIHCNRNMCTCIRLAKELPVQQNKLKLQKCNLPLIVLSHWYYPRHCSWPCCLWSDYRQGLPTVGELLRWQGDLLALQQCHLQQVHAHPSCLRQGRFSHLLHGGAIHLQTAPASTGRIAEGRCQARPRNEEKKWSCPKRDPSTDTAALEHGWFT